MAANTRLRLQLPATCFIVALWTARLNALAVHFNALQGMETSPQRSLLSLRVVDLGDEEESDAADEAFSTFAHLAKCGGTLMKHALRASVQNLRLNNENSRLFREDTAEGEFTIGTIRNPYDYYVSDWAFVSDPKRYNGEIVKISKDLGEKGARNVLGHDIQEGHETFGESADDKARFKNFVLDSALNSKHGRIGLMSLRFYAKYLDQGRLWPEETEQTHSMIASDHWNVHGILDDKSSYELIRSALTNFSLASSQVSCWVKNEFLSDDIRRCLRLYEEKAAARGISNSHLVDWKRLDKKLAEDQRHSNHITCNHLYDRELLDHVAEVDADIIRAFQYRKHCHHDHH